MRDGEADVAEVPFASHVIPAHPACHVPVKIGRFIPSAGDVTVVGVACVSHADHALLERVVPSSVHLTMSSLGRVSVLIIQWVGFGMLNGSNGMRVEQTAWAALRDHTTTMGTRCSAVG